MAIYHCSVKPISRGAGQSIVAAAAYRHGCRMEDKRTGEVHDYSRKRGVTVSAAFFPSDVDCSWATKSEILWNTAELAEKRKDARLGREIVLALPSELSPTERKALAAEMAQHVADRYGVAVDAAIHAPSRQGDDRNFHVHMLVSARRITSKGFGEKARELDDRERGPAEVEHLRAEWARLANRALEQAGQHVQIDHRSFRRQEVKRMPSRHLGASATALERRGIKTRIGDGNRAAARLNALAGQLEAEQAACVSLTEQAQRAAQEVRQYGVDLSREASSVSRPAMPRPTPQRAAEAPQ
ncbi:MobQ family relaxase, partial [Desulfovibrio piger]|nr:MobQ family relaxase [Desulfovibrio piger]